VSRGGRRDGGGSGRQGVSTMADEVPSEPFKHRGTDVDVDGQRENNATQSIPDGHFVQSLRNALCSSIGSQAVTNVCLVLQVGGGRNDM
jgi:hypothetical protein